ncbi:uncharacterized protein fam83ha [Misgurnus anguillicaudatus]|uniref:uncharacterized protein fam83ha n=1 Tax=Misgurnus anguillicaudatus TaxID=75329 RepID=UPI003CCFB172
MPHRSQCSSAGDNPLDPNYLPPHYREEYRIAIDALVDADLEGYYGFLQEANMVGFLSQTEIEYIKCTVRTPHPTVQPDRRYMVEDADGSSDTYWPVHSDHDAPSLDLGWPQHSRFAGPTEVTTLVNPSDPEMPSIKEQVRRMIKSAQEVVAVVMDMFTDVDIFFDILTAAMRGVAVYILLDELNAHHFVSMVNNCRVNLDEIKCMRVRTVCGSTYFCHTGKSFKGQMMDRFILVDCRAVLTGNYSFMWSFEKIHRCLAHLFLGQLVTTFDEEFRILFAHSEPLVVEDILANMSQYSNVNESHLNMDNAHMLKREYPPVHPEWVDHSAEKHMNVGHQIFPFRNPEPYGAEKNPSTQRHMNMHAVQQFRGDQPFIEHGRPMRGPFEMAGFKRHGYPDVPEYEYMPPQNQPTIRGKQLMEGVVPKGSHFAREPGLYQGSGLQPDYDMYGRFRDQGYPMDQFSEAGYPHEVDVAELPGAYDHVQRFLRSQSPMEEGPGAGNLVPPAQSNVRRHSMGQSYACQTSPTAPNQPDQKRLFNANRKSQDVSQKQGLRDWRISSYLSAFDDGEDPDLSELEGSDLCDNVPCFVQEGPGGPVGAKSRPGNTEFNTMPSSRNNPPFIQIQNSSPPPYSLADHPPGLPENFKITPTTTSESSCTTEGDKVEETHYKKPKETNRFGEEFLRSKPVHNVQRSSRLRHSLIFSSNLELNTSDDSKDILGEKDGDEASKLSARVSHILDKRRGSAREPFQWRSFIKPTTVDDQAMESAHSETSLNKIGVSNVDKGLLQEEKPPETVQSAVLEVQSEKDESQIRPKSSSFVDMNDPDSRLRYFKELAAKRKAEFAAVTTSQSKPKMLDVPDKPSMSDEVDKAKDKAVVTIPVIPKTKCEESGADIPETVKSAIQDEKSRRNESNELQRSFSFLDMNDPDSRFRYFKELAAKRKAELAADKTSQSKPEKAPKMSDAPEKPSMSDAEKRAALTTQEIQDTKCEESGADIPDRVQSAVQDERSRRNKSNEWQRSFSFLDMNDPDCRFRYFKELAAKRKAELATVTTSQSKPEKAPKTSDAPEKPSMSDVEKKAALTTQEIQDTKCEESSQDILHRATDAEKIRLKKKLAEESALSINSFQKEPVMETNTESKNQSSSVCTQQPICVLSGKSLHPVTKNVESLSVPAPFKASSSQKQVGSVELKTASTESMHTQNHIPEELSPSHVDLTDSCSSVKLSQTTCLSPLTSAKEAECFQQPTVTEADSLQGPATSGVHSSKIPTATEKAQKHTATEAESFQQPTSRGAHSYQQPTEQESASLQCIAAIDKDHSEKSFVMKAESSQQLPATEPAKPAELHTTTVTETDLLQQPNTKLNESLQHPSATKTVSFHQPSAVESKHAEQSIQTEAESFQPSIIAKTDSTQQPNALGVQSSKIQPAEKEHSQKPTATETESVLLSTYAETDSLQQATAAVNESLQHPAVTEADSSQQPIALGVQSSKIHSATENEHVHKLSATENKDPQKPTAMEVDSSQHPFAKDPKQLTVTGNEDMQKPAAAQPQSVQNPPASENKDAQKPAAAEAQSVQNPPPPENEDAKKPAAAEVQSVQNPPATENKDAQKPAAAEAQSVQIPPVSENKDTPKPAAAETQSVQNLSAPENKDAQKPAAAESQSVQNPPATENKDPQKPAAAETQSVQNPPATENEDAPKPTAMVADSSQHLPTTNNEQKLSSEPSTAKGEDFQESNPGRGDSSQQPTTTSNVPFQHPTDSLKQPTKSSEDSSQSPAETGTDSVMVTEKESSQNPTPVVLDTSKHPIATETPASVCVSASPIKVTLSPQTISFTDTTPADSHILFKKGVVGMSTTETNLDHNLLIPAVSTLQNSEVSTPQQSPKDGESSPKVVLPITTSTEPSPSEGSSSSKTEQKDDNSGQDITKQGSIPATDITPGDNMLSQNITTDSGSSPEHSQTDTFSDVAKPCAHTDDSKMELHSSLEQTPDKPSEPCLNSTGLDASCLNDPKPKDEHQTQNNSSARPEGLELAEVSTALDPVQIDETKLAAVSEQSESSLTPNSVENAISQTNVTENLKLSTHQSSTAGVLSCSNLRDDTKVLLEQISAKNQSRSSQSKQTPANEEKKEGVRSVEQQLSTFPVGTWSSKASPEEREMLLKKMEQMRKERKVYSRFEASC